MKKSFIVLAMALFTVAIALTASGQTNTSAAAGQQAGDPGITPNGVIGEAKAIEAGSKQMIVKTDAGALVIVTLTDATNYLRLAPGETTLNNATRIALTDVGEGDRVWARGKVSEDRKSVPGAIAVVVMTKADISKKQEQERAEWRRRGILGVITALKPETKEITISTRTMAGLQTVTVTGSESVDMRRYAPDSIKFSDAEPSGFDELKVSDQLRALGERSADGTQFTAEKIVTGAFQTVAGKVTAVDTDTGELKIEELQAKHPLTVVIKGDAVLRKFPSPEEMGGMMGMFAMLGGPGGAGAGPGGPPQGGQQRGANRPGGDERVRGGEERSRGGGDERGRGGAGGPGPGGGMRMVRGGFNMQELLDRLPTISIADVKVGDTIVVSSTKGAEPARLTAITMVTGADTLLSILAPRQPQVGGQTMANPAAGLGGFDFGMGLP